MENNIEEAKKKLKEDIQSCKDMMQIKEDTDCEYYKNKIKNWNTILDYLELQEDLKARNIKLQVEER